MTKAARRRNAGAKSSWHAPPTKTIRVPSAFADRLLQIARHIDNGESLEVFIELLISHGITPNRSITIPAGDSLFPGITSNEDSDVARGIEGLYYITHIQNLPSIMRLGVLSHQTVVDEGISYESIYNSSIVDRRAGQLIDGQSLWNFANLYFQPRNAMLYSLIMKAKGTNIAIICLKKQILNDFDVYVSDGNAASPSSEIFRLGDDKSKYLKTIHSQTDVDWWKKDDGSKRRIMAECLVRDKIPPSYIQGIYVAKSSIRDDVLGLLSHEDLITREVIPISVEPNRFFQPDWFQEVTENLYVVKGDMFFSRVQTLTISVNCVGVMGKGLASTAKYRFPDVYVRYQDICKSKKLKLGKPYLCKRESSTFDDLHDEYVFGEDFSSGSQTWFLLFPTKDHWKNKSSLAEIEKGLQWLLTSYKELGIKSLAMPALGCGLGGLSWKIVGPLMCKYLARMDILTPIYLPADREIPNEWLKPDFLLGF